MSRDPTTHWLFYRGFKHYIGKKHVVYFKTFKLQWLARHNWTNICFECGVKVRHDVGHNHPRLRTLDHIIPWQLICEFELYELVYDFNNFRMLCLNCNMYKSNKKLPPEQIPPRLLDSFTVAMDRRERELRSSVQ